MTPAERTLRARIGAFSLHAQNDSRALTARARASFLARFEREVDPGDVLPTEERQRRAMAARSAYFSRLAYKSSRARSARRRSKDPASGPTVPGEDMRCSRPGPGWL